MKLCKDCRWSDRHIPHFMLCMNPTVAVFSPVDGKSETFCDFARKPSGRCRPEGLWFATYPEPTPKTTPKRRWFQWLTWWTRW